MKNGSPIRVGAVSYLNTKPLVHRLAEIAPRLQLVLDLPSRLADALAERRLDVALIPSIEYLRHPGYTIVSNACIACRGPVLSVKLLSRVPMQRIRTLAIDEGSRTSVALAQILLSEQFAVSPELQLLPLGVDPREATSDAVLLIGDRAMHPPIDPFVETWDLGDQWCRWAELPFVFAMWTARPDIDTSGLAAPLEAARDSGLANLPAIAASQAEHVGLDTKACLAYLRDNLHFSLGKREREGLRFFQHHAAKLGIVPRGSNSETVIRFHDCEPTR